MQGKGIHVTLTLIIIICLSPIATAQNSSGVVTNLETGDEFRFIVEELTSSMKVNGTEYSQDSISEIKFNDEPVNITIDGIDHSKEVGGEIINTYLTNITYGMNFDNNSINDISNTIQIDGWYFHFWAHYIILAFGFGFFDPNTATYDRTEPYLNSSYLIGHLPVFANSNTTFYEEFHEELLYYEPTAEGNYVETTEAYELSGRNITEKVTYYSQVQHNNETENKSFDFSLFIGVERYDTPGQNTIPLDWSHYAYSNTTASIDYTRGVVEFFHAELFGNTSVGAASEVSRSSIKLREFNPNQIDTPSSSIPVSSDTKITTTTSETTSEESPTTPISSEELSLSYYTIGLLALVPLSKIVIAKIKE